MRVAAAEFLALPLEVHALLRDVPLKDVTAIDLPGAGARTIADVRVLLPRGANASPAVRALLWLRWQIGRLFRWDAPAQDGTELSYVARLPPALRARSLARPGSADGFFKVLYVLEHEMLLEIRNATVHAFSASVLTPCPGGHRLFWAVYVKPVSRLTAVYMAVIEPFRRFIVYPSMLRQLRRRWQARYTPARA
jgi:hypothetical protein